MDRKSLVHKSLQQNYLLNFIFVFRPTQKFIWFEQKKFSYVYERYSISITNVFRRVSITFLHRKDLLTKLFPIVSREP